MRRDLAMLCPTLLGSLLVGALIVVPGCSLNPQPLPPDQAQDSGLGNVSSPGSTLDAGGHLSGPDASKGGGAGPDAGAIPPEVDGGGTTGADGDASEGGDAGTGQGDGGNDSADGATDAPYDGSPVDASDAGKPDVGANDAGATDASQDGSADAAI